MRFLLFNLVVLGALFYLFTADRADIQAATHNARAVVDRAGDMAAQAVDRIDTLVGKEQTAVKAAPAAKRPEASPAAPEAPVAPIPAAKAESKAAVQAAREPETTPAPAPRASNRPIVQDERVPAPPAAPESKEMRTPATSPKRIAGEELPQQWVADRQVHAVDPAVSQKLIAAGNTTAATQRTETNPVPAAPGATPEIAIAKGETLMTPRERRKELFSLAEDMELYSLKRLGK